MVKVEDYEIKEDLYYHKEHCWVKVEGDKVRIGVDDFTNKAAGTFKSIDLPFEGDEVSMGEIIGGIESHKWVGKLVAPISGTIVEVNEKLEDDPTIINRDPYGEGWIAVIEPSDLEGELGQLMKAEEAVDWIKSEIKEKLKK